MNWKILSQTVTATGDPHEFAFGDPPTYTNRMFAIAAERVGGGSDDDMPRRCLGIGADRASARRSLEETIRTYDSMGEVVPSR